MENYDIKHRYKTIKSKSTLWIIIKCCSLQINFVFVIDFDSLYLKKTAYKIVVNKQKNKELLKCV